MPYADEPIIREKMDFGSSSNGAQKRARVGVVAPPPTGPRVVAPPPQKAPLPNVKLTELPLARLKSMARIKSISLAGCFEKSDILSALRGGGVTDVDAAMDAQRLEEAKLKEGEAAQAKAKGGPVPTVKPAFNREGPATGGPVPVAKAKAGVTAATAAMLQKYSDAGRLKTEILILKKENERLATENQAMKWRLGLGALKEDEDYQKRMAEFNAEQERKTKERAAKEAEGSRLAALEAAGAPKQPPPQMPPPPPQEWSKPDAEAADQGLDLSGVPSPKAMAAEQMRRKLGLSKGAYVLPKPEVDPVCWEWKNGTCKNGHNCPWQHSLDAKDDMRSSQTG